MTGHATDHQPGSSLSPAVPDVEYRLSPQYRRPARNDFVLMTVLTVMCAVTRLPVLEDAAVGAAALAVFFGLTYLWRGRFRTRVTSRGIEIRGYFNHFVPWDQVSDIEVSEFGPAWTPLDGSSDSPHYARVRYTGARLISPRISGGAMSRLATISVVRSDGSKLLLRAPLVSGWAADPDFHRKAWQLDQLCIQHARGAIA
jgi:Bacterial PH domain